MTSSRIPFMLLLAVLVAAIVTCENTPKKDVKPAQKKAAASENHYLMVIQHYCTDLVAKVKETHQQDPTVVYVLVIGGFLAGMTFYFLLSPSPKSGYRKPSGLKRKQK